VGISVISRQIAARGHRRGFVMLRRAASGDKVPGRIADGAPAR